MKIYEIGTGYTPIPATMGAATEIVVEELTKAFQKQSIPVEIIDIKATDRKSSTLPITEVWVPKSFTGTDVKLGIMHKLKRVVYSVCLARKLKKILKGSQERIILHFHNQYNMFFFLKLVPEKLRKKAFTAYTVHSYIWHGDWENIADAVKQRYFQELFCLQHADMIFALNEKTKSNLIQHAQADAHKVKLINNGVSTVLYYPMHQEEKDQLKKNLGMQGKKVFIQVGSVCDRKNQLGALELLMPILQQDPDVMFAFAGGIIDPGYYEQIQALAKHSGVSDQVRYLGELSPGKELNEFYNLAEAMVFPSKAEGFSLVIVESMAAGVPVIVHSALNFALADACIQYTDAESFTEQVGKIILHKDYRDACGSRVRQNVVEQYSWDKIAKDYCKAWGE